MGAPHSAEDGPKVSSAEAEKLGNSTNNSSSKLGHSESGMCVCVPDNVLGQWPSSGLASMSSPWQDSSVRESELGLQDFRRRAGCRGETPLWAGGVSKQEGWTGAQVKPGTWDPTELTQCHQMDKQKAGDYSAENGSFQEWDCQICGSWPCINAA